MTGLSERAILSLMNDTMDTIDKHDPSVRRQIAEAFSAAIPHNRALGLALVCCGPPEVVTRLDFLPEFLGDARTGLWHTGPATAAADSSCGLAVFLALPGLAAVATLDLRMDYWRPARADAPLWIRARCEHVTRQMAFATATIDQGEPQRPSARVSATFTRTGQDIRT